MHVTRRPLKSVYGKTKPQQKSLELWEEAIAASPIVHNRKHLIFTDSLPDQFDQASHKSEIVTNDTDDDPPRKVLSMTDVNIAGVSMEPKSIEVKQSSCVPPGNDPDDSVVTLDNYSSASTIDNLPLPLITSTPQNRASRTNADHIHSHIRFESASPVMVSASPIASSAIKVSSSSDLSELSSLDSLQQLTENFQQLGTKEDVSGYSQGDSVLASEAELLDMHTLLRLCEQREPEDFASYIASLLESGVMTKLGEASFSEVYLGASSDDSGPTVYKVVPFGEGIDEVPINDVIQEVRISQAMSTSKGFVKLKSKKIVEGLYPESLLVQWDIWNREHTSESQRPDWYKADQRYCVIGLEHGGTDLEHHELKTWNEAHAIFLEVTRSLALAEQEHQFEHRDLHWGNILVKNIEETQEVTIIDYTLSRAKVQDSLSDIAYYGFSDRAIFEAEGDDYQFEIYRLMRDSLTDGSEEEESEDWTRFHPTTNVLWLHYLVDKLLYAKGLKKPSLRRSKRTPVVDDKEIEAWKALDSAWNLLNPRRRYREGELAIESAVTVLKRVDLN